MRSVETPVQAPEGAVNFETYLYELTRSYAGGMAMLRRATALGRRWAVAESGWDFYFSPRS